MKNIAKPKTAPKIANFLKIWSQKYAPLFVLGLSSPRTNSKLSSPSKIGRRKKYTKVSLHIPPPLSSPPQKYARKKFSAHESLGKFVSHKATAFLCQHAHTHEIVLHCCIMNHTVQCVRKQANKANAWICKPLYDT